MKTRTKFPILVVLTKDERTALDYLMAAYSLPGATIVRALIREAAQRITQAVPGEQSDREQRV